MKKLIFLIIIIGSLQLHAQTWEKGASLPFVISAVAMKGQNVIVGTELHGSYFSSDRTKNWMPRNNGLDTNAAQIVFALTINEKNTFARCYNALYKSTDLGQSWQEVNSGNIHPHPVPYDLLYGEKNRILLQELKSFLISNDYGETWDIISSGGTVPYDYLSIGLLGEKILGCTGEELRISSDSGYTWNKLNGTISKINKFLVFNSNIYIGTEINGIEFSTDQGNTWNPVNNGLPNTSIISLTTVYNHLLFAICKGLGVYMSSDYGQNWSSFNKGLLDSSNITTLTSSENFMTAWTETGDFYSIDLGYLGVDEGNSNSLQSLSVTPNPISDFLNLSINTLNSNRLEIRIFDALGNSVIPELMDYANGNSYSRKIDVLALKPGIYFIVVDTGKDRLVKEFVKI